MALNLDVHKFTIEKLIENRKKKLLRLICETFTTKTHSFFQVKDGYCIYNVMLCLQLLASKWIFFTL